MARINLLPWREARREVRRKQFLLALGATGLLAVGVVVLADHYIDHIIERQVGRNAFVGQQISALDERIRQISELQASREQLNERMRIIQDLQGQRPARPRVFEQLARALPDDVYFTELQWRDRTLSISGVAASNHRVSELLRNLAADEVFAAPRLTEVKATGAGRSEDSTNLFRLTVRHNDRLPGEGKP